MLTGSPFFRRADPTILAQLLQLVPGDRGGRVLLQHVLVQVRHQHLADAALDEQSHVPGHAEKT